MKRILLFVPFVLIPVIYAARTKQTARILPTELAERSIVAVDGQFPYLVSVQFRDKGHQCSGSIINKTWILTAAHCLRHNDVDINASEITIVAGTNFLDKGGIKYNIEEKHIHEEYKYSTNKNNIALLKLDRDIAFNNNVSSIKLATSEVSSGGKVTYGGWGKSQLDSRVNELLFQELEVVDLITCITNFPQIDISTSTCAEPSNKLGICLGDSGGPVVYRNELVGVLSWEEKCTTPAPVIYSNIVDFRSWIDRKIAP